MNLTVFVVVAGPVLRMDLMVLILLVLLLESVLEVDAIDPGDTVDALTVLDACCLLWQE